MEHLPVEVIGNILSLLGAARDVVVASSTCRKWREAFQKHLCSLSFNSIDWPGYHDLNTSKLEILITQTIMQTTGLQSLTILMRDGVPGGFVPSTVISWFMYTRESLRKLNYDLTHAQNIDILGILGRQKLEALSLENNTIAGVDPIYHRFSCLTSLSLARLNISGLDLKLMLAACPKVDTLRLIDLELGLVGDHDVFELCSPGLKNVYIEGMASNKIVLGSDSLRSLHLKDCDTQVFELMGNGSLTDFRIDEVTVGDFDYGEFMGNLEVLDIYNFTMESSQFYQIISRSSNLRALGLWDVEFENEDEVGESEFLALCFPKLTRISLSHDSNMFHSALMDSNILNNVVMLEVGYKILSDDFSEWVERLLEHCPKVKKLIIHGFITDIKFDENCQLLANFTSSIVRITRRFLHVDVQFEYQ